MAGQNQGGGSVDLFDAYFRRADLDEDGRISGAEAVSFFQASNLSKQVLAQVYASFSSQLCLLLLLGFTIFNLRDCNANSHSNYKSLVCLTSISQHLGCHKSRF